MPSTAASATSRHNCPTLCYILGTALMTQLCRPHPYAGCAQQGPLPHQHQLDTLKPAHSAATRHPQQHVPSLLLPPLSPWRCMYALEAPCWHCCCQPCHSALAPLGQELLQPAGHHAAGARLTPCGPHPCPCAGQVLSQRHDPQHHGRRGRQLAAGAGHACEVMAGKAACVSQCTGAWHTAGWLR